MRIIRSRRQIPSFVRVLFAMTALAFVSLGAAFAWQNAEASMEPEAARVSESSSVILAGEVVREDKQPSTPAPAPAPQPAAHTAAAAEKIKTASEAAADMAAKSGAPAADGDKESAASNPYAREAVPGAVPAAESVGYDYFSDAIFFGDSISTGIPLYMKTMVPEAAVIASQGVSPEGAYSAQCIDLNNGGGRVTMLEAAKTKGERGKVYIMLGANALDLPEEPFITGYSNFVTAVRETYPQAIIYVQSMLPVTASVNNVYKSQNINNRRIEEYNEKIRDMAVKNGAFYVDVAQAVVDGDGFLPTEASPFDGMHLSSEYYIKWFDYLRSHTVEIKDR